MTTERDLLHARLTEKAQFAADHPGTKAVALDVEDLALLLHWMRPRARSPRPLPETPTEKSNE